MALRVFILIDRPEYFRRYVRAGYALENGEGPGGGHRGVSNHSPAVPDSEGSLDLLDVTSDALASAWDAQLDEQADPWRRVKIDPTVH